MGARHCNAEAVDSRWAPDLNEWLAVCAHHVTGRPNTRWRRDQATMRKAAEQIGRQAS